MTRIGASLSGTQLFLLNRLQDAQSAATLNTLRLLTGQKINFPKDDPSGFVQLSNFQTRLASVQQATSNVTAANSLISQTQLNLDQIRTLLDDIRDALDDDVAQELTSSERITNQATIDAALSSINALAATLINGKTVLDGSADFRTTGQNSSQIVDLKIYSIGGATAISQPTAAELTVTGTDGVVDNTSNVTVTGSKGSFTFDALDTNSLAEVAFNINSQTANTGVVAEAVGDQLFIRSDDKGANSFVKLTVNSGGPFLVASGNTSTATGTASVQGTTPGIAGSVDTAATQATLTHAVGGPTVAAADFTLTGSLGSVNIVTDGTESLADFATRVNNQIHATGVEATVSGTDIIFTSVDYGRDEEVTIVKNSGTFTEGSTNGTDAVVTINGQTFTGDVDAQAAELTHYTAAGTIANDAQFQLIGPNGTQVITIDIGGGTNDTIAKLEATIDAQTGTTGVYATVVGNNLIISTTATGASAGFSIRVDSGTFAADGGNGDGTATGADSITSNRVNGNVVTITDNKNRFTFELAAGFEGDLDTVSFTGGGLTFSLTPNVNLLSTLGIPGLQTSRLGGITGTLDDLASGGLAADLNTNTSRALRIVDEALGELARIEGAVDGFANAAISSSSALLAAFETDLNASIDSINDVNEIEEQLLLSANTNLFNNGLAALSILDQNRFQIVQLIKQIAGLR